VCVYVTLRVWFKAIHLRVDIGIHKLTVIWNFLDRQVVHIDKRVYFLYGVKLIIYS